MDNSVESGAPYSAYDSESLPSYTLVSGLPSYDDALDCYRKAQVSTSSHRPSIMKLFSFDNPLLKEATTTATTASSGELQQVVVVVAVGESNKDGLPSYQESVVMVNETTQQQQQKKTHGKRTVHKPMLPIKGKHLSTIAGDVPSNATTPSTASGEDGEGSSLVASKFNFTSQQKKGHQLAQIHKSPSLVLVYDDEYWRNVHQNQNQQQQQTMIGGCSLSSSYSSNSLPRNFSAHLMSEA